MENDNLENSQASLTNSDAKQKNELRQRVIYSFIMMGGGIYAAISGGIAWAIAAAFVMAVLANEWAGISKASKLSKTITTIISALCGLGFVLGPENVQVASCVVFAITLAVASVNGGIIAILSSGYLALCGFAFAALRADENWGLLYIFGLFAVVWATDSSAYAVGRWLKGPKLMPIISPNKTWSGFFGGCVAGTAAGALYSVLANLYLHPDNLFLTTFSWTLVGIILSLACQLGDLLESWLKRFFGVKDSSSLIPGHGGLLDRLDGHLASALILAILIVIPGFAEKLS